MNKFRAILVAFVVAVAGLVFVPAPAQSAAVVTCAARSTQGYTVVTIKGEKPYTHRKMNVNVVVFYNSCYNRLGPNFVRPTGVRVTTNVEGTRMGCATGGAPLTPWYNGGHFETQFKFYFKEAGDLAGTRHFDIPKFSTPCSSNTVATKYVAIGSRTSVPLRVGSGMDYKLPLWKTNGVVDWRIGADPQFSVGGKLRWDRPF